jgi:23S rRNA (guanosine2251-2'-O)-methyltransferase
MLEQRIIYGRNPIAEALSVKGRVKRLYHAKGIDKVGRKIVAQARMQKIPIEIVDKHWLGITAGTKSHQSFVAETEFIKNASLNRLFEEKPQGIRAIMLSNVQDPHNLGAIVRSCEHFGIDILVVGSKGSCDVQSGTVAKTSAGAVEHLPILSTTRPEKVMEEMHEKNFTIFGLEGEGDTSLFDFKPASNENICVIVGSEGEGIKSHVMGRVDHVCYIPRKGRVNSLNMSCANVTACLWATLRT